MLQGKHSFSTLQYAESYVAQVGSKFEDKQVNLNKESDKLRRLIRTDNRGYDEVFVVKKLKLNK
jgi:hypothetical protein